MNITPRTAAVKSAFEVGAQGFEAALALGVVEIDDKQAGMWMDVQGCRKRREWGVSRAAPRSRRPRTQAEAAA
jgi:hypothetical protein